jgi:putative polyketide hydroxylase
MLVERHPGTSIQYKFRGISPRSMEIYRAAGIEREIRACDPIGEQSGWIARMKNLADPEIHWQGVPWGDTSDISPAAPAVCDQDRLEPILQQHAEQHGADIRFATELVDFEQDADGVTAHLGDGEIVRASYLVACDGIGGSTREKLGIGRHGPGALQHWMNVIFDTDLEPVMQGRAIRSVFLTDINGTFVPRDGGRWLMAVQYVPEKGERAEDFTDQRCIDLIRRGAGRNVDVSIVDARPWSAAALVADRYAEGRCFLAGDCAHVMPPTGGFGGNTGIADTWNLAWKLDAVLRGVAGPRLLETYDAERRPVAERTMAQSLARLQAWFKDPSKKLPPAEPIIDDYAVIFGYRYGAAANEMFDDPRKLSATVGSRAPHLVVESAGDRLSTIDLFAGRWTLLAGPEGDEWLRAADRIPDAQALDVECHRIGGDLRDVDGRWSIYGVGDAGAVLVRPDGFIAWRAEQPSEAALRDALAQQRYA